MSTIRQSALNKIAKKKKSRSRALERCPQRKGVCFKVGFMSPKKPNSAERKIAKVRLTTKRKILTYISGIGHNLQEHASVLVRGGRVRDLPGMHYKLVKGKYDFSWKEHFLRKESRSKYGIPSYSKIIR
jgi:small subunit ribosomal protein S12